MANLFIEGFDTYPTGPIGSEDGSPWLQTGATNITVTTADPITGSRSLLYPTSNGLPRVSRNIAPVTDEVYFGLAFRASSFGEANFANFLGSVGGATARIGFHVNASGYLIVRREATILATATIQPMFLGVKHYLEMHVTATTYEARVDGVVVLSGVMANTGPYTSFGINKVANSSVSGGVIDDIYVNDTSGDENNGYMGEIAVITLMPNSDETPQDWVPSVGSTAYEILDNVPAASSYVEADTMGDICAVSFPQLPFEVGSIAVVTTIFRASKTTTGEASARANLKQGATVNNGATRVLAENTPALYIDTYDLDPDTGLAWDPNTFQPTLEIERVS